MSRDHGMLKSYVLYCPHLDRDIRGILARVPDPEIMTGYPTTPGEAGCLAMHQEVVRRARTLGLPYVFVMEDDCKFTDAFDWLEWKWMAEWARGAGYGVVHGGTVRTWNPRTVRAGAIAVDKACSAHCMIYTDRGYDAVLLAEQPFDVTIGEKGGKPVVAWPFVAIQGKGMSGIGMPTHGGISKTYLGPQFVDYEGLFAVQERHLGEVLGLKRPTVQEKPLC